MACAQLNRRMLLLAGSATFSAFLPGNIIRAERLSVPRNHGPATKRIVALQTGEVPGTILISNSARTLDFVLDGQRVARYRIGIGRDGFSWTGVATVGQKAEWPPWRPPSEMRQRDPQLPDMVPPGPLNPLGARALYLYNKGRDTLYRIHGTNDVSSVGGYVTSGCFRLTNADVLELYATVQVGTKVVVRD